MDRLVCIIWLVISRPYGPQVVGEQRVAWGRDRDQRPKRDIQESKKERNRLRGTRSSPRTTAATTNTIRSDTVPLFLNQTLYLIEEDILAAMPGLVDVDPYFTTLVDQGEATKRHYHEFTYSHVDRRPRST